MPGWQFRGICAMVSRTGLWRQVRRQWRISGSKSEIFMRKGEKYQEDEEGK